MASSSSRDDRKAAGRGLLTAAGPVAATGFGLPLAGLMAGIGAALGTGSRSRYKDDRIAFKREYKEEKRALLGDKYGKWRSGFKRGGKAEFREKWKEEKFLLKTQPERLAAERERKMRVAMAQTRQGVSSTHLSTPGGPQPQGKRPTLAERALLTTGG